MALNFVKSPIKKLSEKKEKMTRKENERIP